MNEREREVIKWLADANYGFDWQVEGTPEWLIRALAGEYCRRARNDNGGEPDGDPDEWEKDLREELRQAQL